MSFSCRLDLSGKQTFSFETGLFGHEKTEGSVKFITKDC